MDNSLQIESNPDAVRMARENARANHIENAEFVCADASRKLKEMEKEGKKCSVLFLDPPRSGSSEQFLAAAGRMKPDRIIYVSCNSATAARDIGMLPEYSVDKARVFDFYPGSGHEESAFVLSRR